MMAAMIDSGSAIVAAAVTGSISLIVWTLNALVTSWREVRARRDETRKRFLERQIEEFYGPLLALSRQRNAIHDIRERLFAAFDSDEDKSATIRQFVRQRYYEKLDLEMQQILTNKLHLLEDTKMPDSFQNFLTHTIQADLQGRLWTDEHIDNRVVEGLGFPQAFSADITRTFSLLMTEYRSMQGRK